jgi:hypothetical protein
MVVDAAPSKSATGDESPPMPRNAAAMAAAFSNRWSGDFASARSTTATSAGETPGRKSPRGRCGSWIRL